MASSKTAAHQLPNGIGSTESFNDMAPSGTNGTNNFSLTEYSAMPSPPSEEPKKSKAKVPDDLLLENGHPDVSFE